MGEASVIHNPRCPDCGGQLIERIRLTGWATIDTICADGSTLDTVREIDDHDFEVDCDELPKCADCGRELEPDWSDLFGVSNG